MASGKWTWSDQKQTRVIGVLDDSDSEWCDQLEIAPGDAIVGKVLCVCAASRIAREVLADQSADHVHEREALALLEEWIDAPTDERFERICTIIFEDAEQQPFLTCDPHGVVWWALRTATSSVGNYEAGWALKGVCSAATSAGMDDNVQREIVKQELLSRAGRSE